ncbi:2-hydroxyacid dehydrogenase-related [Holotrichia oblita]|uniref:2-hydroxyacid dehydrogenase-related n=1 Tax=Holotrichia oblita TaxID=644536 RepID=A0ACB9TGF8_HOLOL|nr:2-hydroxyacid dehydrogenase-related [Holotrichia oblita]
MNLITVYSRIPRLLEALQTEIPNFQFKQVTSSMEHEKDIHQSKILIADVNLLIPMLYEISDIKFIQVTRAGVNQLIKYVNDHQLSPCCTIARYTGPIYAKLLTEYLIYHIINHERDFDKLRANQKAKVWSHEGKIRKYRTISDLKIGLLGVGNLGFGIAQSLRLFGGTIYAFRKSTGQLPTIFKDVFRGKENLPKFLKLCDYIISTLPETGDTKGLLNGQILEVCKDKPTVFINVGSGVIISEQELQMAIEKKWIKAAILDVFAKEPLLPSCPLWEMPEVSITPHVAGYNRARDIAMMFRDNLNLFQQGKPLLGVIDFKRGY